MSDPRGDPRTNPASVPHMPADDFRRRAHEVIDWIIDYHERKVRSVPVAARVKPGEVASGIPAHPPLSPQAWDQILADLDRVIVPGMTHWQAPNFHAFFPSAHSYPSLLGDIVCASLGAVGFTWAGCPAMTEVETRVLDWLGEAIGLPAAFLDEPSNHTGGGVIQGTASEATLVAMLAAKHSVASTTPGAAPITAYTSTQAHSSIVKAAMVCGIGRENVRLIETDDTLALRPDLLRQAIEADRAAGRLPAFICATLGTTSTCAFDPLRACGEIAREQGLWLHVDAAYAGAALVCPEHRWMIDGVELADSFCFNPHKWLLTSFDCSALWVKDRRPLIEAMSINPEYLKNAASESGLVIDYRDWQVPLGRRFRSIKLWFVLRHYGLSGLQAFIRQQLALAEVFEQLIKNDPAATFEIVAPRRLGLVCIRLRNSTDADNRRLMERVNASGKAFLVHTVVPTGPGGQSQYVIRVSIGGTSTHEADVHALWRTLRDAAAGRC